MFEQCWPLGDSQVMTELERGLDPWCLQSKALKIITLQQSQPDLLLFLNGVCIISAATLTTTAETNILWQLLSWYCLLNWLEYAQPTCLACYHDYVTLSWHRLMFQPQQDWTVTAFCKSTQEQKAQIHWWECWIIHHLTLRILNITDVQINFISRLD